MWALLMRLMGKQVHSVSLSVHHRISSNCCQHWSPLTLLHSCRDCTPVGAHGFQRSVLAQSANAERSLHSHILLPVSHCTNSACFCGSRHIATSVSSHMQTGLSLLHCWDYVACLLTSTACCMQVAHALAPKTMAKRLLYLRPLMRVTA